MLAKHKPIYALTEAREDLNLTQGQIADKLGTKQSTISKIESGKLLGPTFLKYLKFLGKRDIDLNKVIKFYEFKLKK